jgi:predicted ABC-type ATPase
MAVSNTARLWLSAPNQVVIEGIQWVSTLDDRTTLICIALDGLRWDYPEDGSAAYADMVPIDHDKEFPGPTAHWNCRSTQVPVTYSWEEMAAAHGNSKQGKMAWEVPEGQRAAMDGQVSAETTYGDWLAEQSEERQDEILGEGAARLWRAGAIDAEQLTDPANRVLSLAELEEKYGGMLPAELEAPPKPEGRQWIDHEPGAPEDTLKFYTQADGNLTPERQALHDSIIESFFTDATPMPEGERMATLMMGGTASGKSTIVQEILGASIEEMGGQNFVRIDADLIKTMLPEYESGVAASARDAAAIVHEESSVIAGEVRERAIAEGYSMIVDGTGANADKYSLLLTRLSDEGYHTNLVAMNADVEQGVARSAARAEQFGRWVPEKFIRDTYAKIPASFAQNSALADNFMLFDNSGTTARLVWAFTEDGENVYDARYAARFGYDATKPPREAAAEPAPVDAITSERRTLEAAVKGIKKGTLPSSANETQVVELVDGTRGVFKPLSGESESLMDQTSMENFYLREAAASDVANIIGLDDIVPQTIAREVNGEPGSFRRFIPDAKTAAQIGSGFDEAYDGALDNARAAAFDYLTGQTDRHGNNWMLRSDGKLMLIDNALSFPSPASAQGGQEFYSKLFDHAAMKNLAIPREVEEWKALWPQIAEAMRKRGLSNAEIAETESRLSKLTSVATFGEL